MHIRQLRHPNLHIDEFTASPGECWSILGSIGSGIDEFLQLLEGQLPNANAHDLALPARPAIISADMQQTIYEDELRNDDSDFLDRPDPGTPAHAFLPQDALSDPLIDLFNMRHMLETGYRQLSSGQSRKLLLLQAILNGSTTIIIDSPYDGLDPATCRELDKTLSQLTQSRLLLMLLIRNIEDMPSWCTHLAAFSHGHMTHCGPRETVLEGLEKEINRIGTELFDSDTISTASKKSETREHEELVVLKNGFAGYGENLLFSGLDLSIDTGRHTLITGPNGCGKSTLLHIITGDNPKCYANDLSMFGRKRGSGESIWDIKKKMGIVSPEIHRNYRVPGNCLHVVLSGLFDSIGLYQRPTSQQQRQGRDWLAAIKMADQAEVAFRRLSYGRQRLVLIARALIKQPPLLILDEPTQGLDSSSRRALLDFLEQVASENRSTILYVSHRQDEYRSFFRQHIKLEQLSSCQKR